jgi:hypothetical protein
MRRMRPFLLRSVSLCTMSMMVSVGVDAADIPQPLRASYFHPHCVILPNGTPEEQTSAVRIYLNKAAEVELDGHVASTWNTLLLCLDELEQTGDIQNFPGH